MGAIDWDALENSTFVTVRFVSGAVMTTGISVTTRVLHEHADMPADVRELRNPWFFLTGLPLALFRKDQDLAPYVDAARAAIEERDPNSWAISLSFDMRDDDMRRSTPSLDGDAGVLSWAQFGPYDAVDLDTLVPLLMRCVANVWVQHQAAHCSGRSFRETFGCSMREAMDEYHQKLDALDGEDYLARHRRGRRLLGKYNGIARDALSHGDSQTAAHYSRPLALCMRDIAHLRFGPEEDNFLTRSEFADTFAHLANIWNTIEVGFRSREAGLSTIVSEGYAEWMAERGVRFMHDGQIRFLDPLKPVDSSPRTRSQLSPSHPYRRGLELMKKVEHKWGADFALLTAPMASAPLRSLRWWATYPFVCSLELSSPWSPDWRLEQLANVDMDDHLPPKSLEAAFEKIARVADSHIEGRIEVAERLCGDMETPRQGDCDAP